MKICRQNFMHESLGIYSSYTIEFAICDSFLTAPRIGNTRRARLRRGRRRHRDSRAKTRGRGPGGQAGGRLREDPRGRGGGILQSRPAGKEARERAAQPGQRLRCGRNRGRCFPREAKRRGFSASPARRSRSGTAGPGSRTRSASSFPTRSRSSTSSTCWSGSAKWRRWSTAPPGDMAEALAKLWRGMVKSGRLGRGRGGLPKRALREAEEIWDVLEHRQSQQDSRAAQRCRIQRLRRLLVILGIGKKA